MTATIALHRHADRNAIKARAEPDFLSLFDEHGGKRRGKGGKELHCPFHEDKKPSASIHKGRFRCFTCNLSLDPFDFVAKVQGTDFRGAMEYLAARYGIPLNNRTNGISAGTAPTKPTKPTGTAGGWREVARYPYQDRDGNVLFEAVRYLKPNGEKAFRQCRPNGHGGFIWNLDGIERVPYRLPKVLNADMVYLPEGEKDVHTLEEWGFVASCNPGGAGGSDLYAQWGDYFRGRDLIIPIDNDESGRKHALEKAEILVGVAASIRIVELPGLPEKGDVTDWRDAGGTLEQFYEIVHGASPLDAGGLAELRERWGLADEAPPHQARAGAAEDWPKPRRGTNHSHVNGAPAHSAGAGAGHHADESPVSEQAAPDAGTYSADPAQMVGDIEQFIRRFLVLPDAAYLPLAIWIIATYAAGQFDCFPYLALLSPAKRCGKTRLLEVLETLVHLAWRGTAPTPAALFRMMADGPTLLLDEVEALGAKNKSETALTILAILNAGYRKGATIPRCDGQKHELKHFAVYGPKVFAAIGKLPDTLADRSIVINMQRRTKGQKLERFRQARANAEAKPIRDGVTSFIAGRQSVIEQAHERLTDLTFLSDRDAEMWIPLFAVCSIAAPDRLAQLRECAVTLSGAKAEDDADESLPLKLLADIRVVWPEGQDRWDTASLIEALKAQEESPWTEYELSPRKVVRFLRPFGVESRKVRIGERTLRGYEYCSLEAAFSRYLESQSGTSGTNQ